MLIKNIRRIFRRLVQELTTFSYFLFQYRRGLLGCMTSAGEIYRPDESSRMKSRFKCLVNRNDALVKRSGPTSDQSPGRGMESKRLQCESAIQTETRQPDASRRRGLSKSLQASRIISRFSPCAKIPQFPDPNRHKFGHLLSLPLSGWSRSPKSRMANAWITS